MSRRAPVGILSDLNLRILRVLGDADEWLELDAVIAGVIPQEAGRDKMKDHARVLAAATSMRRSGLVAWYRPALTGQLRFRITPFGAREIAAADQMRLVS